MAKRTSNKKKDSFLYHAFISISVTLILLILIEVGLFVVTEIYVGRANAEKHYDQDDAYLNDVVQIRKDYKVGYCSFLDHCMQPYNNSNFSVVAVGERTTINNCNLPGEAKTVYVYGGSTTFAAEVLDADTWASYLSDELCKQGHKVIVRNFGETGYTNSQELVKLLLHLRDGERPDVVVFYDGANDFYSTYQNGKVGESQNVFNRHLAHTVFTERSLINPLYVSSTFKALRFFSANKQLTYTKEEAATFGTNIKLLYAANGKIIETLGEEYEFTPVFFWQPIIMTKEPLSQYEAPLAAETASNMFSVHGNYQDVTILTQELDHFYDISDVFDGRNETIFTDPVHVAKRGNRILAQAMAQRIAPLLD